MGSAPTRFTYTKTHKKKKDNLLIDEVLKEIAGEDSSDDDIDGNHISLPNLYS